MNIRAYQQKKGRQWLDPQAKQRAHSAQHASSLKSSALGSTVGYASLKPSIWRRMRCCFFYIYPLTFGFPWGEVYCNYNLAGLQFNTIGCGLKVV